MCCFSVSADDRFRFGGYGSLVGGKVVGGELDPSGEKELQVELFGIYGSRLCLSMVARHIRILNRMISGVIGGYYFLPKGTYIAGTADVTWSKILGGESSVEE
jgi:hypothetical protein